MSVVVVEDAVEVSVGGAVVGEVEAVVSVEAVVVVEDAVEVSAGDAVVSVALVVEAVAGAVVVLAVVVVEAVSVEAVGVVAAAFGSITLTVRVAVAVLPAWSIAMYWMVCAPATLVSIEMVSGVEAGRPSTETE